MTNRLNHENLDAYRKAIAFVSYAQKVLADVPTSLAVHDQLERAAESVPVRLAVGNGQPFSDSRTAQFDYAYGSALECAACLDILGVRLLVESNELADAKRALLSIVRMILGLRKYIKREVREEDQPYCVPDEGDRFAHESLDVYQLALKCLANIDVLLRRYQGPVRNGRAIDKAITSVILNIAEGNGRFSIKDHSRFLDIAHTSALRASATIDVMVAGGWIAEHDCQSVKRELARIVSMIFGLQRSAGRHDADLDYD